MHWNESYISSFIFHNIKSITKAWFRRTISCKWIAYTLYWSINTSWLWMPIQTIVMVIPYQPILHINTHSPPHYAYVDNELCHLLLILSRSHSVESKPVDSYSWIKTIWFLQLNQSQLITAGYQSPFQISFKRKFSFGKKKFKKKFKKKLNDLPVAKITLWSVFRCRQFMTHSLMQTILDFSAIHFSCRQFLKCFIFYIHEVRITKDAHYIHFIVQAWDLRTITEISLYHVGEAFDIFFNFFFFLPFFSFGRCRCACVCVFFSLARGKWPNFTILHF